MLIYSLFHVFLSNIYNFSLWKLLVLDKNTWNSKTGQIIYIKINYLSFKCLQMIITLVT